MATTVSIDSSVDVEGTENRLEYVSPRTCSEEITCYIISRQRDVRCRLWYEVVPFVHGLFKYSLVGVQQLE